MTVHKARSRYRIPRQAVHPDCIIQYFRIIVKGDAAFVPWDFSLPAQRHSRRPSQILLSAPLPVFSLVRSLFPLPAAVALQAHSLLRVARFRPFPQTKKKKRRRCVFFPFCLKATKRCVSEVKTNKSTPITLKINTKVLTSQYHCDII